MNNYVLIMAGGVGSRFWPASREDLPKQFLDILNIGKTLLEITYERCARFVPPQNIYIATNYRYRDLVLSHLPEITENQLILEPSRNNTGPCIAYAAIKLKLLNPESCMAVMPSDHIIENEDIFIDQIKLALDYASRKSSLITLGIFPSRPDTGYGYIKASETISSDMVNGNKVIKVAGFTEKPDANTAQNYLDAGDYLWNAGIFIWKTSTVIEALKIHAPGIYKPLIEDLSRYNSREEWNYIQRVYPTTQNISIDYALMENSPNIYTLPVDIGWNDLGTWASLYDYLDKDENQNVVLSKNQRLIETNSCLVKSSKKKLVVVKGLEDYIVIDENNVLLIYPKSDEQEIKTVRNSIENKQFK